MSFPERSPDASQWKVCDLTVDLETEYDAALAQGLPFIKIFADVVTIPKDFSRTIGGFGKTPGGYVRHIQVIARRMEMVGSRAKLRINAPREEEGPSSVGLLVGEMAGTLQIDKVNYDAAGLSSVGDQVEAPTTGEAADLCYTRYSSATRDGQLVKVNRQIEFALLQSGGPLHGLFTASYAHAAARTGAPTQASDAAQWRRARQMFDWLARWTKYPGHGEEGRSDIALFAEALTRVLPTVSDGNKLIYAIPLRPSATILKELRTQFDLARQMEANLAAAANSKDLKATFGEFVATLSARDKEDLNELDFLILAAGERVRGANGAVDEAAEKIKDLQLESKLAEIRLNSERETQAIWDTVKSVFQIVYGLYQLVTGIGSGLLAANATGAVKAVGQIPTTMQFFFKVAGASSESLGQRAFQVAYTLGYLPFSEMNQAWNTIDKATRKALINGIKNGVPSLMEGAGKLNSLYLKDRPDEKDLNAIASLVSDATQAFDAAKSKATWETFQVDLEKALDPEIASDKGEVGKAAMGLKAALKKLVIAGQLLAQQQSMLAVANRELGTLILRRSTLKSSRALFEKLALNLSSDKAMGSLLVRTATARLVELKQSFFAKTWEYKAAYFHEWGRWPKQRAVIPADATEFGLVYSRLEDESTADAAGSIAVNAVRIEIDDLETLRKLRDSGQASFMIDLQQQDLAAYQMIRLKELLPTITGVTSKATGAAAPYSISLISAPFYQDAVDGHVLQSQGRSCSVCYSYHADGTLQDGPTFPFGGVNPSPFTEWTVKVGNPEALDLTGVKRLRLDLKATALRKS